MDRVLRDDLMRGFGRDDGAWKSEIVPGAPEDDSPVGIRSGGPDESGQLWSVTQCPVELLKRNLTGSNGAMQRLVMLLAVEAKIDNCRAAVGPDVEEHGIEQHLGD